MRQVLILVILLLSFSGQAWAQETNRSQCSSAPETSRFEIIQSELAAKVTLKIDKYTGKVFQLVKDSKGLSWQLIPAEKHPGEKATANKVNYQVFTSGLAVRMTYLINVNTGASWQLCEDSELGVFWSALK
jgi:hypothetical protein